MTLATLNTLINTSAQNLSQFKGLSAAYGVLLGGAPSIDGYTFLINENNTTNFGAGGTTVFNDENIYINTINALYKGNTTAKSTFDAIISSAATVQDALTLVYNYVIPASLRTTAGLDYFKSQATYFATRAAEIGNSGTAGTALVGFASLMKIAVDNDIGGLGDTINDLRAAVGNGTAVLPQGGEVFTALETADGTQFDVDDVATDQGQTFTLTAGVDNFKGGNNADVFTASEIASGATVTPTLTAGDTLDGGAGNDTLKILQSAAINGTPGGVTVSNIENVTLAGGAAVTFNSSAFTGVTSLASTQSVGALALTAAKTTDVTVSGASDTITVDGGKDITVTDAIDAKQIKIGDTTVGAGKVTVTDTKVGNAAIAIDGGTDVTVNATGSSGNTITVGNGGFATDLPTGVIVVNSTSLSNVPADATLSGITAKGGSTISITQTATSTAAAADTAAKTLTQGAVTAVGGGKTTDVTVTQTASQTAVSAVTAVAGVTETASIKFGVLKNGDSITIGGDGDATLEVNELRFTASKDLTAAEVAQAFANFVSGAVPVTGETQGSISVANGIYSTSANTSAFTGWSSGAVAVDTVVFTSITKNTDVTDLAINLTNTSTNSVAPTLTTTAGSAATAAVTGKLGVITGAVTINDNATASIKTVTLDGYDATTIGGTAALSKLETVSLSNSGGATAGANNATVSVNSGAVTTLALNLNKVMGGVTLDSDLKTLNVKTSGANSTFALTADGVETLAVSGDKAASFTGDLLALKTVTVSGSAGLTLAAAVDNSVTSINTAATTGSVSAQINGSLATYTGGSGKDTVTLSTATALTKAIDLGDGDDTLSFAALGVTGSTAALAGGAGVDTLSMTVAAADTLDATAVSFYTGFERLLLNNNGAATVDLGNLGFTNYVTTSGSSGSLVLNNLASNGTVVLTAAATTDVTVGVKDAATGTADVVNVILSSTANLAAGKFVAANVETINISTVDTEVVVAPAVQTKNVNSLELTADRATSVTVTGVADLTLTMTGSTKVTSIDASTSTGAITVTSLNTTSATTIKGSSGNDVLTAATGTTADVLIGNLGQDTLTGNAGLSTLTGGADNDLFVVNVASQNVNSYSTITDFVAGDLVKFTGSDSFQAAKVSLGATAVFQDYANSAVNAVGVNDLAWFQYAGDTYIVMDAGADSTTFNNGQDFVVKLTGLVDLANASYNVTHGTIGL